MCAYSVKSVLFIVIVQLLCKSYGLPTQVIPSGGIWTVEAPYGENVMIECVSNDDNHNFDFWVVENQQVVIGPSNTAYNDRKFHYDVLTGNLTIKALSRNDEGVYSCYSRGVTRDSMEIHKVNIRVQALPQNFEDVYEHDYNINVIRILIVLIALVLLAAGGYVVYRIWKDRYRYPSYLEQDDDDDEDSNDEIFSAPTTSRAKSPRPIVIQKSSSDNENFETISTDFTSILDATTSK